EESPVLADMRVDYSNELAEFRNVHIGLTLGTGTTELNGPNGDLRGFWEDPPDDRATVVDAFFDQANTLAGYLGGNTVDTRPIEQLDTYLATAADPVDGPVALIYENAIEEYASQVDD